MSRIERASLSIATSTFYRKWYPGDLRSPKDVDKIRGDLAIESTRISKQQGYRVIVVDGGSSHDFVQKLSEQGASVYPQTEPNLSGSRRQAISLAAQEAGTEIICTTEPEKVSVVENMSRLVAPLLRKEADITIPARDDVAFSTYPPLQAAFEQKSNRLANAIATKHIPGHSDVLDYWIGVRAFHNTPDMVSLFQRKYSLVPTGAAIDQIANPDIWANALYLPVFNALASQLRVMSVDIDYVHPTAQTQSEIGDPTFDRKRDIQHKNIILNLMAMVRLLQSKKSKLAL